MQQQTLLSPIHLLLLPQARWALVLLDVLCLCGRDLDTAAMVPAW